MAHEDMLMGSALWRPSRSPTFHQNMPSPTTLPPTSTRLEHFRSRQEAAISFEDDLEFNPSLTPEEVNEARRTLGNLAGSHPSSSPPSPPRTSRPSRNSSPMFSSTRAIPIIDPNNKTPLALPAPPPRTSRSPPPQYVRSTNATTSATAFSSIFSPPYNSPPSVWASAWDLKPTRAASLPTRSIPIVDPTSGSILNASPDRRAFYAAPAQQQRMGGNGWFDVTVR